MVPHSLQNQTGIGVAKIRCREMHQSHSICPIQFSMRRNMCPGVHFTSRAAFIISSGAIFTNHCRSLIISIGVLHRQQVPTRCSRGSCRLRIPSAFMSERIASLHSPDFLPSYFPATGVILP